MSTCFPHTCDVTFPVSSCHSLNRTLEYYSDSKKLTLYLEIDIFSTDTAPEFAKAADIPPEDSRPQPNSSSHVRSKTAGSKSDYLHQKRARQCLQWLELFRYFPIPHSSSSSDKTGSSIDFTFRFFPKVRFLHILTQHKHAMLRKKLYMDHQGGISWNNLKWNSNFQDPIFPILSRGIASLLMHPPITINPYYQDLTCGSSSHNYWSLFGTFSQQLIL